MPVRIPRNLSPYIVHFFFLILRSNIIIPAYSDKIPGKSSPSLVSHEDIQRTKRIKPIAIRRIAGILFICLTVKLPILKVAPHCLQQDYLFKSFNTA